MPNEICQRCKRRLNNKKSIQIGYGNTCYLKVFGKVARKTKRGTCLIEGQKVLFSDIDTQEYKPL